MNQEKNLTVSTLLHILEAVPLPVGVVPSKALRKTVLKDKDSVKHKTYLVTPMIFKGLRS